jgi:hypothetical protein
MGIGEEKGEIGEGPGKRRRRRGGESWMGTLLDLRALTATGSWSFFILGAGASVFQNLLPDVRITTSKWPEQELAGTRKRKTSRDPGVGRR